MITLKFINLKQIFRVTGILTAIFLVLLIAAFIWISSLDLNTQITRIETLASQALARDVKIDGPLQFRPSLFPRIIIENVHIANPQWATHPDFLTADKLEIEISFLSLLYNQLVFEDIELTGATINLQRDPEKGSSWDFRKHINQQPSSSLIPDLVELDAHQITIMYYPSDRPPIDMHIDELHAVLSRNEPVEISLISKVRNLPLNIELQGGTFEQLINPDTNWPFKGTLETDTRTIDFDGHITNLITLNDIEIQFTSDKQTERESILFGAHFEPLIEHYQAKLNINNNQNIYTIKLTADAHNFDLSRLYKPEQRAQKPSLKYQDFTIDAQGSGQSISEILQTAVVNVSGSNFVYLHPINQPAKKYYQVRISSLQFQSKQNAGFELLLNGTANHIPFKARASTGELLSTLWQKKKTPIKLDIESKGATIQIKGNITHGIKMPEFSGHVSMKLINLAKLGDIIGQSWLEIAALKAQSNFKANDRTIIFSNVSGQLGSQKAKGEVKLSYNSEFNLSIKAHADHVDAHQIFSEDEIPPQLVLNLEQVNISLQGKNQSFVQSLLGGKWKATASKGKGGWCTSSAKTSCILSMHNILLNTQDNNPLKLSAKSLHNQKSLNLIAELGRLKTLSKDTAKGTSPYHPLTLKLNAEDLSTSFQGALHKPLNNFALLGELQVNGELSSLAQLINLPLKHQQKMSLRAHLSTQRNALILTNINANTDGLFLKGKLNYQTEQSPNLTASTSGRLDLAHFFETPGKTEQSTDNKIKSGKRIIPDISLDYSIYRSLDTLIKINDFSINYGGTPVFTIDTQFSASNGMFKLGPSKTLTAIGMPPALSSIELDNSQQPARARYTLQAKQIDYGNILQQLEVSNEVTGSMDLNIDITGQGNTLRKVMETSNGELQIIANKGKVPRRLLELWGSGLLRSLFPTILLEGPSTDMNCAVADFKLENGTLRSQTLLTDTRRVTVAGDVVIDLKTEQIEGLFKPQPKEATLMHIGIPLRLTGTLANSKISSAESGVVTLGKWAIGLSNPATLIVLFGDTGAKDKNPCAVLLKDHSAN